MSSGRQPLNSLLKSRGITGSLVGVLVNGQFLSRGRFGHLVRESACVRPIYWHERMTAGELFRITGHNPDHYDIVVGNKGYYRKFLEIEIPRDTEIRIIPTCGGG